MFFEINCFYGRYCQNCVAVCVDHWQKIIMQSSDMDSNKNFAVLSDQSGSEETACEQLESDSCSEEQNESVESEEDDSEGEEETNNSSQTSSSHHNQQQAQQSPQPDFDNIQFNDRNSVYNNPQDPTQQNYSNSNSNNSSSSTSGSHLPTLHLATQHFTESQLQQQQQFAHEQHAILAQESHGSGVSTSQFLAMQHDQLVNRCNEQSHAIGKLLLVICQIYSDRILTGVQSKLLFERERENIILRNQLLQLKSSASQNSCSDNSQQSSGNIVIMRSDSVISQQTDGLSSLSRSTAAPTAPTSASKSTRRPAGGSGGRPPKDAVKPTPG